MNTLQLSNRQLGIAAAVVAAAALAVFSLGLATATAFNDGAGTESDAMAAIAPRPDSIAATEACIELPAPAAGDAPAAALPAPPPTATAAYGVQTAVFAELDNAVEFAARQRDPEFPARIFRRVDDGGQTVYAVMVGLYPTMDEAQQAKQAFIRKTAIDSFVADASRLREEIVLTRTLAMLH